MFKALAAHLIAIPFFALQLILAVPAEGWRHAWKRIPLFFIIWILFSVLNLLHILGHLLDEVIFFAYREVPLTKAVFILGIPRSGTTYLQRLLAKDPRFTTFTTWEAMLAPSLTEKYFYRSAGRLLQPLKRWFNQSRRKLLHRMDSIHILALDQPEEDFLLLLPVQGCLLLAFVCPGSAHYWRLGFFDQQVPPWFKNMLMTFYQHCLQKHLYFHGQGKILLSKNPSFTSLTESLLKQFPEAKIIACTRSPLEVVPSQLSSLRPIMSILGNGMLSAQSQHKMIELLYSYYRLLGKLCQDSANCERIHILPMTSLQSDLALTMTTLFQFLSITANKNLIGTSSNTQSSSANYTSKHKYDLNTFSISERSISEKFNDVWPLVNSSTNPEPETNQARA